MKVRNYNQFEEEENAAMSSRSSRKTVVTTTTTQRTPSTTPGKSPGRRDRPPSPVAISRLAEKNELASLNDRLAAYIDRVRFLETENAQLSKQIRAQEETVTRERTNVKVLFENELADARKLLDELSKEKAKLQIEVGKYKSDADDWKDK